MTYSIVLDQINLSRLFKRSQQSAIPSQVVLFPGCQNSKAKLKSGAGKIHLGSVTGKNFHYRTSTFKHSEPLAKFRHFSLARQWKLSIFSASVCVVNFWWSVIDIEIKRVSLSWKRDHIRLGVKNRAIFQVYLVRVRSSAMFRVVVNYRFMLKNGGLKWI